MARGIVDLRKRRPGLSHGKAGMRPLAFREAKPHRSSLRARRRRLRAITFLAALAALALAAHGVSVLSYLPRFSVQDIRIAGAKEIRPELVHSYVEARLFDGSYRFLSPVNIFLYPRARIEEGLIAYFPRVRSARVSRPALLSTTIVVSIEEREAFARWCLPASDAGAKEERCFLMDRSGVIFAPFATSTRAPDTGYVFRGGVSATSSPAGQAYLPGAFSGVLALLERLTTLPELSCGGTANAGPLCVDARKARLFADMLAANDSLRIAYYPVFGSTNITLRVVDITTGNARDFAISDASRNDSVRVRSTRTFVTVFDPSDGDVGFGMLEIRRSIG